MLITRARVDECLKDFFRPEDRERASYQLIVDLSWMASIVLEYGFQCPSDKRAEYREKFFNLIRKVSDAKKEADASAHMGDYSFEGAFKAEKKLTIEDLGIVCYRFREAVGGTAKIPKDNLLEWLGKAWDIGVHQHRVYDMEVEGVVMNEYGIIIKFGTELAMLGGKLIPESCAM